MVYVVGVTLAGALIFGLLISGRLEPRSGEPVDRGVRLLIILAWLRVVTPSTLQLFIIGRIPPGRREYLLPPTASAAVQVIGLAFLLVVAVLLITSLSRRPARHIGWLAAALAPWAALQLSDLLSGGTPDIWAAAYPMVAVAIWLRSPHIQVLVTIGALTVASAAASLLLVAMRPDLALYASGGVKTVYESGLLAGIYQHANMLGIALALGIPFILLIQSPKIRMWCLALCIGVLLATASRSSMAAAAAAMLLWLLIRRRPDRALQRTAMPLLAAVGMMAYLPLTTKDPEAFTERGRIWLVALEAWHDRPWTGWGSSAFAKVTPLLWLMRGQLTHAHNLLVMTLLTGGLVMAVAMAVMLFLTWRRAVHQSHEGYAQPLIFLTTAIVVSWLEASLTINNLTGWALWLPLLVILLGRSGRQPDDVGEPVAADAAAGRRRGRDVRLPSGLRADRVPFSRTGEHEGADAGNANLRPSVSGER